MSVRIQTARGVALLSKTSRFTPPSQSNANLPERLFQLGEQMVEKGAMGIDTGLTPAAPPPAPGAYRYRETRQNPRPAPPPPLRCAVRSNDGRRYRRPASSIR